MFFAINHDNAGLNHVSFEVQDMDDVFMGHQHMRDIGKYEHMWGIGRHLLGSQVYDYWADPWRRVHEHWADSDRLNIKNGSNLLVGRGSAGVAVGRPAAAEVHRARQPVDRLVTLTLVMAGLAPRAIHALLASSRDQAWIARHKAGHDS